MRIYKYVFACYYVAQVSLTYTTKKITRSVYDKFVALLTSLARVRSPLLLLIGSHTTFLQQIAGPTINFV